MLQSFNQFINLNRLFSPEDRCLLAISGGVDSMVMAHLFQESGLSFGIAHCNFKLRGKDSDGDEQFVEDVAKKLKIPFYTTSFDTVKVAENQGLTIQEAARNLRYDWLESIQKKYRFDYISTAHHLNDSLETVLYNFTKGSGIRGLHGIPLRNGKVIRPLLFAEREQIEVYAKEHEISFREDASNTSDKYARNKIRLQVIPALKELNPAIVQTSRRTIRYLSDAEYLMDLALKELRTQLVEEKETALHIDLEGLQKHAASATILFEWTREMGFHSDQVMQGLNQRKNQPGAVFYSATHRMLFDRKQIIIAPVKDPEKDVSFLIRKEDTQLQLSDGLLTMGYAKGMPATFSEDNWEACLAADKLTFPLKLRHWEKGDYFMPFGMKGKRQKLKDFFVRQKVTRFEKERIWLLETFSGEICWIIGHRMDDRFKINSGTTNIYLLKFKPS